MVTFFVLWRHFWYLKHKRTKVLFVNLFVTVTQQLLTRDAIMGSISMFLTLLTMFDCSEVVQYAVMTMRTPQSASSFTAPGSID
jgi:hypothetical protein